MRVIQGGSSAAAGAPQAQFGVIDLLKAGAAQLIVLHHLAFYGPMADRARPLAPGLVGWLGDEARMAVQVFLVIGGFLAAKSLCPDGRPGPGAPVGAIWRRYLKLAPPFMAAMFLAAGASLLAGMWMTHDSISAPPGLAQVVAHALLLHDVLGYGALSAGAWYVAIDFQLYALMSLLLWACGRLAGGRPLSWLAPAAVTAGVAASLLYFNLDADWDVWAPYFLGSYGMGALAWWASNPSRRPRGVAVLLCMMALPALLSLMLDFRERVMLAFTVACALFLFGRVRTPAAAHRFWALAGGMGRISYSVFLVHFPVCLVVNAAFTRFAPHGAHWQAAGAVFAWAASLAVGAAFFRWVELPIGRVLARWLGRRPANAGMPELEPR
ncbi:acyltransferase family protein [Massilia consociata]|uniref:Acyltransferase family protein n=1 Tax=Massilia consociata TaxID=760117 RepID=A0ABV6FFI4_9BURK